MSDKLALEDRLLLILRPSSLNFEDEKGISVRSDLENFAEMINFLREYSIESDISFLKTGAFMKQVINSLGLEIYDRDSCPEEFVSDLTLSTIDVIDSEEGALPKVGYVIIGDVESMAGKIEGLENEVIH